MGKKLFNDGWSFMYQTVEGSSQVFPSGEITLPHDAMISRERYAGQEKGTAKGYFPNVKVLYAKKFFVAEELQGQYVSLQFDGVYRNARVFVNGNYAGGCHNGYERFYVDVYPYLQYGAENEVVVEAASGNDSRWYSGAGIYRNVYLLTSDMLRFAHGGVKLCTKEADASMAVMEARLHLVNSGFLPETVETVIELLDADGQAAAVDRRRVSVYGNDEAELTARIYISNPKLWDTDSPNLYTCKASVVKDGKVLDEMEFLTGVRTLTLDPVRGLCLNGKQLKMYGGCVHHDHGMVGSAVFAAAEDRKVRLLKEAGYNALRFSHNPMSDELMTACDRYGMVVMDELSDMWNRSKTFEDHGITFAGDWKQSVASMVDCSYNHPCVIMHSVGNEIKELSDLSGKKLGRELAAEFRRLDASRYVTCGINSVVCMMPAPTVSDPTKADVEEINTVMTQRVNQMGEIQCQEPVIERIREFSEVLDIVGYNYAEDKQLIDLARFTNRICVGSETFPKAIAKNWKMMQEHPAIIGDFSWTAWDYLGEAGIGKNGLQGQQSMGIYEGYPYKLANCGDIDITGSRRTQSYYRECVVGRRQGPYIAVINPKWYGRQAAVTPWSWSDSVSSWSWDGSEGKPVQVEVYGVGDEAELIVNGISLGRKRVPQVSEGDSNAYSTVFDTVYRPGRIEAVLYQDGQETGRYALETASDRLQLLVEDQNGEAATDGKDLLYFMVSLTDEQGILKPACDREVRVSVSGAGMLQGFGSAAPLSTECFTTGVFTTYYGKAALAVRPVGEGEIHIQVQAEGCDAVEISL